MSEVQADGIHALVPRDQMAEGARKLRDTYAITPGAPLYRREFGFFSLERWKAEGMPEGVPLHELFQYDPPGSYGLGQLGWCEAAFVPAWDTVVVEDRGDHEVVQDYAGRCVLYFKGRRNGFMPEYLTHPVKDRQTWEEDVKWRLDPGSSGRYADLEARMETARSCAGQGFMIQQNLIGGYMYLRSLIGPADLLYAFHDMPDVIHDCMRAWFDLSDAVIARHQDHVTIDEIYFAEDICYNHGPLISPDMMREFLLPYYQQIISNLKARQLDPTRHLYVQIDTDGLAPPTIPVYREIGMDAMSPFEVASGCDVVQVGRDYPDLAIFGGMDKREMAKGRVAIDAMVERVLPAMRERGGYIPTCDHGVPEEVSYEDYLHYRQRCVELGG
jgi:uroporphyrinogen decarboxylase